MQKNFEKLGTKLLMKAITFCQRRLISVIDYLQTISDRPVLPSVEPGFMRESLPSEMPVEGVKWDEIQPDIEKLIMVLYSLYLRLIIARDHALATPEVLRMVPEQFDISRDIGRIVFFNV